jgi:hypothetical protein
MVIFHSYVKLPEGTSWYPDVLHRPFSPNMSCKKTRCDPVGKYKKEPIRIPHPYQILPQISGSQNEYIQYYRGLMWHLLFGEWNYSHVHCIKSELTLKNVLCTRLS